MSISVLDLADTTITESPSGPFIDPNNATIANIMRRSQTLDAVTTPRATKYSCFQKALSAGSGTIDLTSLPDNNGLAAAVTFSGLRIAKAIFRNPSTNGNAITITFGASNPHLLGGSGWKVILLPGEVWEYTGYQTGEAIDATHKTWDLSGTGAQALDVFLVAGA